MLFTCSQSTKLRCDYFQLEQFCVNFKLHFGLSDHFQTIKQNNLYIAKEHITQATIECQTDNQHIKGVIRISHAICQSSHHCPLCQSGAVAAMNKLSFVLKKIKIKIKMPKSTNCRILE